MTPRDQGQGKEMSAVGDSLDALGQQITPRSMLPKAVGASVIKIELVNVRRMQL
jgi:hypothetical protein